MAAIRNHSTLPVDLVIEILLRSSVKSLLRFKSVCKQWYTTITSSSFISQHFHHESNHTHLLLKGLEDGLLDPFLLLFSKETLERLEHTNYANIRQNTWILRGPCNGIFCMLHKHYKRFALWNPAARRIRPLPYPPRKCHGAVEFDFGMDPLTLEIKIVLIYDCLSNDFAVYTSSNDSWKYYENGALPLGCYLSRNICATTFLNGFCYWRKYYTKSSCFVILAFDLHNESFLEIEMPEVIKSLELGDLHLYNDSLALFMFNESFWKEHFDIWAMEENGSWIKLLNVVVPYKIRSTPLGFWKSAEIFLINYTNKEVVMYDPTSNKTRVITIENCSNFISPFYFRESLVSVKGENGIEDYDSKYFSMYTELECCGVVYAVRGYNNLIERLTSS